MPESLSTALLAFGLVLAQAGEPVAAILFAAVGLVYQAIVRLNLARTP